MAKKRVKITPQQLGAMFDHRMSEIVDLDPGPLAEAMREHVQFVARFPKRSFRNVTLMQVQRPDATRVYGYRTWQKMGFQVRPRKEVGPGIRIFSGRVPIYRTLKDGQGNPVIDPATGEPGREKVAYRHKVVSVWDITQVGIPCFVCQGRLSAPDATACEECGTALETALPARPSWWSEAAPDRGLASTLRQYATHVAVDAVPEPDGLTPTAQAIAVCGRIAEHLIQGHGVRPSACAKAQAGAVRFAVCGFFRLDTRLPDCQMLWNHDAEVLEARLALVSRVAKRVVEGLEGPSTA